MSVPCESRVNMVRCIYMLEGSIRLHKGSIGPIFRITLGLLRPYFPYFGLNLVRKAFKGLLRLFELPGAILAF